MTLLAACGDPPAASKDDEEKPTTTSLSFPTTTAESIIGGTTPDQTTSASPTTEPVGLPSSLGIPPATTLTLGGGSSLSSTITVRGVALDEVIDFVRAELAALGWAVQDDLTFAGPGAVGQATVTDDGGVVEIRVVLSAPPG